MEFRMIYKNGKANVVVIQEPDDMYVDMNDAMNICVAELEELVKSIHRDNKNN